MASSGNPTRNVISQYHLDTTVSSQHNLPEKKPLGAPNIPAREVTSVMVTHSNSEPNLDSMDWSTYLEKGEKPFPAVVAKMN